MFLTRVMHPECAAKRSISFPEMITKVLNKKRVSFKIDLSCTIGNNSQNYSDEENFQASEGDDDQYDKQETYFIKLTGAKQYDMKLEHFDDMIQDNSI